MGTWAAVAMHGTWSCGLEPLLLHREVLRFLPAPPPTASVRRGRRGQGRDSRFGSRIQAALGASLPLLSMPLAPPVACLSFPLYNRGRQSTQLVAVQGWKGKSFESPCRRVPSACHGYHRGHGPRGQGHLHTRTGRRQADWEPCWVWCPVPLATCLCSTCLLFCFFVNVKSKASLLYNFRNSDTMKETKKYLLFYCSIESGVHRGTKCPRILTIASF